MFWRSGFLTLLMHLHHTDSNREGCELIWLCHLNCYLFFKGHFFLCHHNSALVTNIKQCLHGKYSVALTIISGDGLLQTTISPPVHNTFMFLRKSLLPLSSSSLCNFSFESRPLKYFTSFSSWCMFWRCLAICWWPFPQYKEICNLS